MVATVGWVTVTVLTDWPVPIGVCAAPLQAVKIDAVAMRTRRFMRSCPHPPLVSVAVKTDARYKRGEASLGNGEEG